MLMSPEQSKQEPGLSQPTGSLASGRTGPHPAAHGEEAGKRPDIPPGAEPFPASGRLTLERRGRHPPGKGPPWLR